MFETRTETCYILYGYSPDKVLKYDLDSGVFTSPPDLSSSAGLAVSVLLTDMDLTQEVSLSTNTVSNTTVYTPSPTGLIANSFSNYAGNYYLVRDKNTGSIVDFDDNPTPYLNLPFLPAEYNQRHSVWTRTRRSNSGDRHEV